MRRSSSSFKTIGLAYEALKRAPLTPIEANFITKVKSLGRWRSRHQTLAVWLLTWKYRTAIDTTFFVILPEASPNQAAHDAEHNVLWREYIRATEIQTTVRDRARAWRTILGND